jgi:hypothetical protein
VAGKDSVQLTEASQRLASPPVKPSATIGILVSSDEEDKVLTYTQSTSNSPISSSKLSTHAFHSSVVSSPTLSSSCISRFSQQTAVTVVKNASTPPTDGRKATTNKAVEDTPAASKMTDVSANHWRRSRWRKGLGLNGGAGHKKKTSKPSGIKAGVPEVREGNPAPTNAVHEHVRVATTMFQLLVSQQMLGEDL